MLTHYSFEERLRSGRLVCGTALIEAFERAGRGVWTITELELESAVFGGKARTIRRGAEFAEICAVVKDRCGEDIAVQLDDASQIRRAA